MFVWTKEREALVSKLWDEGLPAARIAEQAGTTKNAIIGKARRMGLKPRRAGHVPDGVLDSIIPKVRPITLPPISSSSIEPDSEPIAMIEPPVEVTDVARYVKFEDLQRHHCREVVGYEKDGHKLAVFCGATKVDDKPYCAYHCSINYRVKESK